MATSGPSRRAVLVSGLVAAGALSGCLPGSDEDEPELTREEWERQRLGGIRSQIERLAAQYDAVQLRFPDPTGMLVLFAAEHRAHVEAVSELMPRVATSASAPARKGARSHQSSRELTATTAEEARALLVAAERAASKRRAEEAAEDAPRAARLLASVSACNAVHAALLEARSG